MNRPKCFLSILLNQLIMSRGILKLPPTVKKLQIIFSILLMIPIRVCCLPRHALFFFINQTGWIRVGCRGCAKRRAAIDSAQDWTDQAKVMSSESFLLCIQSHSCCVFPLTPFSLQSIFVCWQQKNGERTAPNTVRPLSILQTNSMCAKKQMLLWQASYAIHQLLW